MNTTHTPGPWVFATKLCDHVTSPDGCVCMLTDHSNTGLSRPILERRANAKLIASAPELLSWLKWSMNLLSKNAKESGQYEMAQAAIAKATGVTA